MIASHNFALYAAKQTARGAYEANPTYGFEVISGGLVPKPNVASLNVSDNRMFGVSAKRISYIECGGQVTVTAQPKAMGAILAWAWGVDTPSGGSDPYTHVITPATTLTAFPYITFWQYFDGQWTQFRDCQIVGCDIECTNDGDGFMRLVLTVIGLAVEKRVAAPTPPADETDKVHWLDSGGYNTLSGDHVNLDHSDIPTDAAELYVWLAAFKTKWNAHCAVASGRHHKAADTTNTLSYATPVATLADAYTALDEIETKHEAHRIDTTVHYFADTTNTLSWATPASEAAALACAAQVIGMVNSPGAYNRHLGATPGAKSLKVSFQMNAKGIQGEGLTAYAIHRAPGTIMGATDLLMEDFRLINLAKFGDIAPAAGAETTSEIQTMSLYRKFIASTSGNERSISIYIPQFDLDPEPLMTVMGGPDGSEIIATVGGEATGTAPIATVTVVDSVATF